MNTIFLTSGKSKCIEKILPSQTVLTVALFMPENNELRDTFQRRYPGMMTSEKEINSVPQALMN